MQCLLYSTVRKLDRIQNRVGRFVLQLPYGTSTAGVWMEAGFRPMMARIRDKRAAYIWTLTNRKRDPNLQSVLDDILTRVEDPWLKEWIKVEEKTGPLALFRSKKAVQRAMDQITITEVQEYKAGQITMAAAPEPEEWFKLQGHVNDSECSKILCLARAGAMQLGNRYPDAQGRIHKICPLCPAAS